MEDNGISIDQYVAKMRIERKGSHRNGWQRLAVVSPKQISYSRHEFVEGEWLGKIVVGAPIKAANNFLRFIARREHQNAGAGLLLPNDVNKCDAVAVGQAAIENCQGIAMQIERSARFVQTLGAVHGEIQMFQLAPKDVGDFVLVLDQ
jgi:hypothetical protein